MTYLPSLPEDAKLLDVFRAFPDTSRLLLEYHEVLLRGPSSFTVAQRELIAAYVSGLNACDYCLGVHATTAAELGVDPSLLTSLLDDLDSADVESSMKPVLAFVRKLTLTPSKVTPADAEAVLRAGWDEPALHDATSVCALFSFMNRLVNGLGVTAGDGYFSVSAKRLHAGGYAGLAELL